MSTNSTIRIYFVILSGFFICTAFTSGICPVGDISGDQTVNLEDISLFAQRWLDNPSWSCCDCADLNADGTVDSADFALMSQNWQTTASGLVINEYMAKNDTTISDEYGDYQDWIELYNPSDAAINIGGWYLTDNLADPSGLWYRIPTDCPDQTTIPAHGYLLLWADSEPLEGCRHLGFNLSVNGEDIGLFACDQTPVDSVTFGPQVGNCSMGRCPDGVGDWRGFCTTGILPPTAGLQNCQPPRIVITEIMYHPYHRLDDILKGGTVFEAENLGQEYIELLNQGSEPVNLSGWRISNGVDFIFPDVTIFPGDYLVVAADVAAFRAAYDPSAQVAAVGGWVGKLSNSGEIIELVDAQGLGVDRVEYADQGDWSVRLLGSLDHTHRGWLWSDDHDGGGKSLELKNSQMPNEFGQNWAASLTIGGTPGAVNSVMSGDIPPMILDTALWPMIPSSADPVTVTANIVDESTAGLTVALYYRIDQSTYTESSYVYNVSGYSSVTMLDDGAHSDGTAGDGVYGAQIPAQLNGTIIEFYVRASDAGAHVRTWPAPAIVDSVPIQAANLLYQVDDSFDPLWTPGTPPYYYLIMRNAERLELQDIGNDGAWNGEAGSDAQMNATFIHRDGVDMKIRYNTGVRNRGKGSRATPPMNYHVSIPSDRRWKGVTAINLNSLDGYCEVLGHAISQMAGLIADAAAPANVRVNGQNLALTGARMYGLYSAVEAMDSDWASHHFPDDSNGNLYRGKDLDLAYPTYLADLAYLGTDPDAYRWVYFKQTNMAEDNWSDLIQLTNVLNNTPADTYMDVVGQNADIEQWLRYLANDSMLVNVEGGLSTGKGDDYALYRGIVDPRFRMVPHDLDTIMGQGDHSFGPVRSIFTGGGNPGAANGGYRDVDGLYELLTYPQPVRSYYQQFLHLIDTAYSPQNLDPLIDQLLGNWIPQSTIVSMKQFNLSRIEDVLSQIPQELTVTSGLSVVSGYPRTTDGATVLLSGKAHGGKTGSVLVNGIAATWNGTTASWSLNSLTLKPGINRISVEAFDGPAGSGSQTEKTFIDVWYDDGSVSNVSGTIGNMTLTAAAGPWQVTANVVVPAGVTLTIEPGTTLYFAAGTSMTVNGRLVAQGTPYQRIRLTRQPGAATTWNGIQLQNTVQNNILSYADIEYADTSTGAINMANSVALIDNVSFSHSERIVIKSTNSSAIIRNSVFAELFPSYDPTAVNVAEQIVGSDIPDGGYFTIENNIFGKCNGHNDVLDFSSRSRPHPIVQILNNTFLGTGDEMLDSGGDALIEGNVFMHEHKDQYNIEAAGESNCISTGDNISGSDSTITVVRNIFYDIDHAVDLKRNTYMYFENNVVANVAPNGSAIKFLIPQRDPPGRGAYVEGCIFMDLPKVFENADMDISGGTGFTTDLEMNYCLVDPDCAGDVVGQRPGTIMDLGVGNFSGLAHFVDPPNDFALRAGPGIGTGPNGLDMGADVPAGASIAGEPPVVTWRTSATLTVGGPGITDYKHRVNGGSWSTQQSVDVPITLAALSNGDYTVEVIGLNYAGLWQDETAPTISETWTVNTAYTRVIINEVLAHTHGSAPDLIELYNDGPASVIIGGMTLTDDPVVPAKYVIPLGTTLASGQYKIFYGAEDQPTPDYLGFALSAEGEGLYLYDSSGNLIDSVEFGLQINDVSIGRLRDGQWHATAPTFGSANVAQELGDLTFVKINEWLANEEVLFEDDFIELYNADDLPVELSGTYLTDNPVNQPAKHQLAPLSFIPAKGFTVVIADDSNKPGHVNFKLSADQEIIGLFDADLNPIDRVIHYSQTTDVSQGRSPDGANTLEFFTLPTPTVSNVMTSPADVTLVAAGENASYHVPMITDAGADWTNPTYNDLAWDTGQTPLGFWNVQESWTAYNDCVYGAGQYTTANVTYYGIGSGCPYPASGQLVDRSTGAATGVTVTFSQSGGVIWDASTNGNSGFDTNAGTDAYNSFHSITDMMGLIRYSDVGWWVDLTFSNLDPEGVYMFVTSSNRGYTAYTDRITRYTILDAESYTNASSNGVTVNGPDSVSFCTGNNTTNGYMAKWTNIKPGPDGSFRVRAESGNPAQYKAYAFDVFMLSASGLGGSALQDQMVGINSSAWFRIKFDVEEQALNLLNSMTLQMRYEDAFVAYLNGAEVARDNFTPVPAWNSNADSNRANELADEFLGFDISDHIGDLQSTNNVLSIQTMNDTNNDLNFLVLPVLTARSHPDNDPQILLDNLRITELMYNPIGGNDYEFIELQNIGAEPLRLGGVRFTEGIEYTFPAITLAPNAYVVVVSNLAAFQSRYGTAINVAGVYGLNLSNGSEKIVLNLAVPLDAAILRFTYSDSWYPQTDGGGYSLAIEDPYSAPSAWQDPTSWRPSNLAGGSPGTAD